MMNLIYDSEGNLQDFSIHEDFGELLESVPDWVDEDSPVRYLEAA